tara:strand:- start:2742 stop:3398 length:657 start_codon:yes stop_codon:yes gene_type:complete
MKRVFTIISYGFNFLLLIGFMFFGVVLVQASKAENGAMADAETAGPDIELLKISMPEITPKLVGEDVQALCMALNIYYESRSDNLAGQYAVADVVLNRMHDDRYPNTVCDVVRQGPVRESWKTKQHEDLPDHERIYNPIRNMCQFSWYCDGKSDDPKDETGWAQAQYVAGAIMYSGKYRGITEGATHYHATYVKPKWRLDRGMNHIGRVGSHIFYRWD